MNLNHCYIDLIKHLPITDSRLRPDIRALEFGDNELASKEKDRLEVKQRAKRHEMEANGAIYQPQWFHLQLDKQSATC